MLDERLPQIPSGAWECNTIGNHDRSRSYTFFSDGVHDELRARLALAMVMFLPGTPVFYYGEEIGMRDYRPASVAEFRDGFGRWVYNSLCRRRRLDHEQAFDIAAFCLQLYGPDAQGFNHCKIPYVVQL